MANVFEGFKKAATPFITNRTVEEGGLTALVFPFKFTGPGLAAAIAAKPVFDITRSLFSGANRAAHGTITYQKGLDKSISRTSTGAPEAMKKIAGNNYQAFADMARHVITCGNLSKQEDYGANPALISALYNMNS